MTSYLGSLGGKRGTADASGLIAGNDLAALLGLPLLTLMAWSTPASAWPRIGRALAPLAMRGLTNDPRATLDRMRARLAGHEVSCRPEQVLRNLAAAVVERELQLFATVPPRAWEPDVEVEGKEHLHEARRAGRGVILWDSHFVFNQLLTKLGLNRAGYPLVQLSHPRHGFSPTRFGMLVLNRIPVAIENRYLRERVTTNGAVGTMRTLQERLEAQQIVVVTARPTGRRSLGAPFFSGTLELASGAPDLAYASRAPLLPVFTMRDENGSFRVVIDEPLAIDASLPRHEASEEVVCAYAGRLQGMVKRFPDQWLGWFD